MRERKCKCRKKEECSLQVECVIESVVYKARVKEERSGEEVSYIGSTEGPLRGESSFNSTQNMVNLNSASDREWNLVKSYIIKGGLSWAVGRVGFAD